MAKVNHIFSELWLIAQNWLVVETKLVVKLNLPPGEKRLTYDFGLGSRARKKAEINGIIHTMQPRAAHTSGAEPSRE